MYIRNTSVGSANNLCRKYYKSFESQTQELLFKNFNVSSVPSRSIFLVITKDDEYQKDESDEGLSDWKNLQPKVETLTRSFVDVWWSIAAAAAAAVAAAVAAVVAAAAAAWVLLHGGWN